MALAVAVCALGLAELWAPFASVQGDGSRVWSSLTVLLAGAPLALRRRAPLAVALVGMLPFPLLVGLGPAYVLFWGGFLPLGIALFSVARHGSGRQPSRKPSCAAARRLARVRSFFRG